jgi:hypothetical protein
VILLCNWGERLVSGNPAWAPAKGVAAAVAAVPLAAAIPVVEERPVIGARERIWPVCESCNSTGTPFCVTVDFETLGERDPNLRDTVTLRERDSMKQDRIAIKDLLETLRSRVR